MKAIKDRIFWIYLIIVLAFIVIGAASLATINKDYIMIIVILWIFSNIFLLLLVYQTVRQFNCCNSSNITWLLINGLFLIILVLSTIWTFEMANGSTSGIFIILGGLLMYVIIQSTVTNTYVSTLCCALFTFLWFVMASYTVTTV